MSDATEFPPPMDVRRLPTRERHDAIFRAFQGLASGDALLLIIDYDPRALRYHLEEEHGPVVGWEYLERGPVEWRVAISRLPDPQA